MTVDTGRARTGAAPQRDVCRLSAARRRGERDIDVFHDTTDAAARSWDANRAALTAAGYDVEPTR